MTDRSKNPTSSASAPWRSYWEGSNEAANAPADAAVTGGRQAQYLDELWTAWLENESRNRRRLKLLDIACGAGVVARRAANLFETRGPEPAVVVGVDYAPGAAASLRQARGANAVTLYGVAASADKLPLTDKSVDLVVSQFGAEYAGRTAFAEAARVLAPDGAVLCVSHMRGGALEKECAENAAITDAILKSGVFEIASALLRDGAREAPSQTFNAACASLRPFLARPPVAAHGLLTLLLRDAPRLLGNRGNYQTTDLLNWFSGMEREVAQYGARMKAMMAAALDEASVESIANEWAAAGLTVNAPLRLRIRPDAPPFAWRIEARRKTS